MKNYGEVKRGDYLKRNAYNTYNFTVGKEYQVLTLVDGQPRVQGDSGDLVTLTGKFNPKYFDHISLPDPKDLKAGDLVEFFGSYLNTTVGKPYIVNSAGKGAAPYIYNDKGRTQYLSEGTKFRVVGTLKHNMKLADQVKPGDMITRIKPGGQYHTMGKKYKVLGVLEGLVKVNTDQGYVRLIKADSEKNWMVEPKVVSITVHETGKPKRELYDIVKDLAKVVDQTTALRAEAKQVFLDLGLDEETAKKAMEQALLKGLKSL